MSLPRLVALSACVLALSACGVDSGEDTAPSASTPTTTSSLPSPTPTATPTRTPTATASPTASPTQKPSATPTSSPAPVPPPVKDSPPRGAIDLSSMTVPQFDNESTTVTCLFDGHERDSVRCDVMPPSGWKVAKPAGCQDAYGDAIMLALKPRLVCHGDTIWSPDTTKVIKKGQTYRFGTLWCTAASATSVTCRNPDGRGFTVTQQAYRVF